MRLDYSVSLGSLVTITVFVLGMIASHRQSARELQDLKVKVDLLFRWWEKKYVNGNSSA